MRAEPCVCGGLICAPSLKASPPYVEAHNASVLHVMWRAAVNTWSLIVRDPELEAELVNRRPSEYIDPRRRTTAGTTTRDLSGSKTGTSSGVEGAN